MKFCISIDLSITSFSEKFLPAVKMGSCSNNQISSLSLFLLTNFDSSCLYVSNRQALINSLTINPEYLKTEVSNSDTVFDYRDWQIPLGRKFRSLKLFA